MDFMSERVADGRWFLILTVLDQLTQECLCLVLTPSATLQAPMGYGVAMRKQYYTHLSAEDRETLSLGLAHSHSLRTRATVLGRVPSIVSRESARNTLRGRPYSRLYGAGPGDLQSLSTTAILQTLGSLAVAVCADASDSGLLARTDCLTPPTRVS